MESVMGQLFPLYHYEYGTRLFGDGYKRNTTRLNKTKAMKGGDAYEGAGMMSVRKQKTRRKAERRKN